MDLRRARGFSMVEAMVALVVLSVGLLGATVMLLDSLRSQSGALLRFRATHVVRDMADRIHANRQGRGHYDTRYAGSAVCGEPEGCDVAGRAAADRAAFAAGARSVFAPNDFSASVEFAPAIGPAAPDRYVITLRWRDDSVKLQVLAQLPVAG